MDNPVNRYGKCPNCEDDWDGGDIYETVAKVDVNGMKSTNEILKLAAEYGWTPENPKRFSNTNTIEYSPTPLVKFIFLECPNCKQVWDAQTGQHFTSINKAKNGEIEEVEDKRFEKPLTQKECVEFDFAPDEDDE